MLTAENTGEGLRFGPALTTRFLWMPAGLQDALQQRAGVLPLYRASAYADRIPEAWRRLGTWIVPIPDRTTVWIEFVVQPSTASAVKIGLDALNLLSRSYWRDQLTDNPQDYLVLSEHPATPSSWLLVGLDHLEAADPDDTNRLELAQLSIRAFRPRPEYLSVVSQRNGHSRTAGDAAGSHVLSPAPLVIRTDHCRWRPPPDPYGVTIWNLVSQCMADINLVSFFAFRQITGEEPPPPRIVPGPA